MHRSAAAAVRAFAEDSLALAPEPPPSFGRVLRRDGYAFCVGPRPVMTIVQQVRLAAGDVPRAVRETRALRREHDRPHVLWWIGPSTTPADLPERLRALGAETDVPPPFEREAAIMVLDRPPPAAMPPGVEVRRVASAADVRAATAVGQRAFGMRDEDRAYADARADERAATLRDAASVRREYLALRYGEPVGSGIAVLGDAGAALLGGAVVPEARGQGIYRALVAARWRDAEERGTPALVVQAGRLSGPILDRLGFVTIGHGAFLVDRG